MASYVGSIPITRSSDGAARRLFIGLMPDTRVRAEIDAHRAGWFWPPGCRPTAASRLHLTLHFLGLVEAPRAQELHAALAEVRQPPLQLELRHADVWPQVAVLRPAEHAGLRELHARLLTVLERLGIASAHGERFTPHVTLARQAAGAAAPEAVRPIAWTVGEFSLVWSQLGARARYLTLAQYPLRNEKDSH